MAWRKAFSGRLLWVTNTASSFALYFMGDIAAQKIELSQQTSRSVEGHKEGVKGQIDLQRAVRMASMSFIISPWQTGFYLVLDRRLPGQKHLKSKVPALCIIFLFYPNPVMMVKKSRG